MIMIEWKDNTVPVLGVKESCHCREKNKPL